MQMLKTDINIQRCSKQMRTLQLVQPLAYSHLLFRDSLYSAWHPLLPHLWNSLLLTMPCPMSPNHLTPHISKLLLPPPLSLSAP